MPTSLLGLALFVVLLAPGMVYVRRREQQQAAKPQTTLRETTTIVLASAVCELLVVVLLALARTAWPEATPDIGALVRDPDGAFRSAYASLMLWGVGLLATACIVALAVAVVNLPARIGRRLRRVRWLAWLVASPDGEITPTSVWWNTLYGNYPKALVHVGCVLDDGSYIDGFRSDFDPSLGEQAREIALAAPIRYCPPGSNVGYQPPGHDDGMIVQQTYGVLLTTSAIRVLFVRPYPDAQRAATEQRTTTERATSATPDRNGPQPVRTRSV